MPAYAVSNGLAHFAHSTLINDSYSVYHGPVPFRMGSTVFKRGQASTRADGLSIFLKSKDGSPKNAATISYSVYDFTTGVEVLLPPGNRAAANAGVGEYYADFVVPPDANIGKYRIRWQFREYVNSKLVQVVNEFTVVESATQVVSVPGISAVEFDLVRSLRIMLRDNNPGRNYHFVPPAGEESINQFTRVFGYIWEDQEMLEFLRLANSGIAMHPPLTFHATLDLLMSQHPQWRQLLITGAMIHALTALSANWIQEEFDYSISGVSLNIDKSSKYQSLADSLQSRFDSQIEPAKSTVKITRGLQQSRYGVGIRSSFGPSVGRGSLTPKRFLGI